MNTGRKITGGKYHQNRKKKLHERRNQERQVVIGEPKRKTLRVRGGNVKTTSLREEFANLIISGKVERVEIKNVVETPQNRFLARSNRLMKGSIIETEKGKAKITNRPSQEGHVNAIIIKE